MNGVSGNKGYGGNNSSSDSKYGSVSNKTYGQTNTKLGYGTNNAGNG